FRQIINPVRIKCEAEAGSRDNSVRVDVFGGFGDMKFSCRHANCLRSAVIQKIVFVERVQISRLLAMFFISGFVGSDPEKLFS
ncbi:MAG: hypothetical protein ACLQO6_09990, partial [Desulfomonilaceae bacterium]